MTGPKAALPSIEEVIRKSLDAANVAETKTRECHPSMQSQAWAYVAEAYAAIARVMVENQAFEPRLELDMTGHEELSHLMKTGAVGTVVGMGGGPSQSTMVMAIPDDATAVMERPRTGDGWKSLVARENTEIHRIYRAYLVECIKRSPAGQISVGFDRVERPDEPVKVNIEITTDVDHGRFVMRLV